MTKPAPPLAPSLATLVAIAAALSATGCARHLNERPTLGNAVHTATFRADPTGGPTTTPPQRTSEHTSNLNRSGWPGHVFLVPVDGTVHGPVRHRDLSFTKTTRRQEGLFPTVESALDLDGDTGHPQALEGMLAPFAAAAELAWMPISLVLEPPAKNVQSPTTLHKRTSRHAWSSAPIAETSE